MANITDKLQVDVIANMDQIEKVKADFEDLQNLATNIQSITGDVKFSGLTKDNETYSTLQSTLNSIKDMDISSMNADQIRVYASSIHDLTTQFDIMHTALTRIDKDFSSHQKQLTKLAKTDKTDYQSRMTDYQNRLNQAMQTGYARATMQDITDMQTMLAASNVMYGGQNAARLVPKVSRYVQNYMSKKARTNAGQSSLNDASYAYALAQDKGFLRLLGSAAGAHAPIDVTNDNTLQEVREFAKFAVKSVGQRIHRDEYANRVLRNNGRTDGIHDYYDILPKNFHSLYQNKANAYNTGETQSRTIADSDAEKLAIRRIQNLVRSKGRNGDLARELVLQSGMATRHGREYNFNEVSREQLSYLGNLAFLNFAEAKESTPQYFEKINGTNSARTISRGGKRAVQALNLMNILSGIGEGYAPSWLRPTASGAYNNKIVTDATTIARPETYYIPRTLMNADGSLTPGQPTWRKVYNKNNPFGYDRNDKYVGIQQSAFTELVSRYTGGNSGIASAFVPNSGMNNTYGFGRVADGSTMLVDRSPIIQLDVSDLTDRDTTGAINVNESRRSLYSKNIGRNTSLKFSKDAASEAADYVLAFMNQDAAYMLDRNIRDRIISDYASQGFGDPFGFFRDSLVDASDQSKTAKYIEAVRKMNSPSVGIQSLGLKNPRKAFVDLGAMYNLFGDLYPNNGGSRLDGLALINSGAFFNDFQGRDMLNLAKFSAKSADFQLFLRESLKDNALTKAVASGLATSTDVDGKQVLNELWMPAIGAFTSDKERDQVFGRIKSLAGSTKDADKQALQQLRENYFHNIMDPAVQMLLFDSTVKNPDAISYVTPEQYKNFAATHNVASFKAAPQVGHDGRIHLNARQQLDYGNALSDYSGGTRIMQTADDFADEDDFISTQMSRAFGKSTYLSLQSALNYDRLLNNLKNPAYAQEFLFAGEDPNMAVSDEGKARINDYIAGIERKRNQGYLYMPGFSKRKLASTGLGNIFEVAMRTMGLENSDFDANNPYRLLTVGDNEYMTTDGEFGNFGLASRNPAAGGMYALSMQNIANKQRKKLLEHYGDRANSLQLSLNSQFLQNTGDFDGDFDVLFEAASQTILNEIFESAQKDFEGYRKEMAKIKDVDPGKTPDARSENEATIDYSANYSKGQGMMGVHSSTIEKGYMLSPLEDRRRYIAGAYGSKNYDAATTFFKTQVAPEASPEEWEVLRLGTPFTKFARRLLGLDEESDSKLSAASLFKTALPNVYDPAQLGVLESGLMMRESDNTAELTQAAEALDYYLMHNYKQGSAEAKAAQILASNLSAAWTGSWQLYDDEDIAQLNLLADQMDKEAATKDFIGATAEMNNAKALRARIKEMQNSGNYVGNFDAWIESQRRADGSLPLDAELAQKHFRTRKQYLQSDEDAILDYYTSLAQEEQWTDRTTMEERRAAQERQIEAAKKRNAAALNAPAINRISLSTTSVENWIPPMGPDDKSAGGAKATVARIPETQKLYRIGGPDEYSGTDRTLTTDSAAALNRYRANAVRQELGLITDPQASAIIGSAWSNVMEQAGDALIKSGTEIPAYDLRRIFLSSFDKDALVQSKDYTSLFDLGLSEDEVYKRAGLIVERDKNGHATDVKVTGSAYDTSDTAKRLAAFSSGATMKAYFDDIMNGRFGRVFSTEGKLNGEKPEPFYDPNGHYTKEDGSKIGYLIRPDAMTIDDKGHITVIDHKTGEHGAQTGLLQATYYASEYDRKAEEYWNSVLAGNENQDLKKYSIFGHLVQGPDGKQAYESMIKQIVTANIVDGFYRKLAYNDDTKQWAVDAITAGRANKYQEAKETNFETGAGFAKYLTEFTIPQNQYERQGSKIAEQNGSNLNGQTVTIKNDADQQYVVGKLLNDDAQIDEIRSRVNSDRRKYTNLAGGSSVSRYQSYMDQLNSIYGMKPQEAEDLLDRFKDDPIMSNAVTQRLLELKNLQSDINNEAQRAASFDLDDFIRNGRSAVFGAKGSAAVNSLRHLEASYRSASHTKDYLTSEDKYYDKQAVVNSTETDTLQRLLSGFRVDKSQVKAGEGEKEDDIIREAENRKKAFEQAYLRQQDADKAMQEFTDHLLDQDVINEDRAHDSLLTIAKKNNPVEKLKDAFAKQEDNIRQYIMSKDQEISDLENLINEENGVIGKDTEQGRKIQQMIETRKQRRDEAQKMFDSGIFRNGQERLDAINDMLDSYAAQIDMSPQEKMERDYEKRREQKEQRESELQEFIDDNAHPKGKGSKKVREQVARAKELLQRSKDQNLDEEEALDLSELTVKQQTQAQQLLSSLTGSEMDTATMRALRAASMANQIKRLQNAHIDLPKGFDAFFNDDGSINTDKISRRLEDEDTLRNQLALSRSQVNGNINVNSAAAQRTYMQRQFDMTRTQYGPTFTGRAWQYNDQQLAQWEQRRQAAQNQIESTTAHIAELTYQKDHTNPSDTDKIAIIDQELSNANNMLSQYTAQLNQADAAMQEFSSLSGGLRTGLINIANAAEQLILGLGKRGLQAAFKEASTFIRQFDADMTTIQEITGKSDQDMRNVRSSSIDQAKSLRTSVSNVTSTRAALYRQGLSDTEVEDRAESIIKFSTVTGAKITDATKNLTTAIQTGLVSSVNQAMDVLAALGDSAATTAEEIAKGMQKAAASAKVAGVSYEELTSMLTIATSKTQLSGAQAGTFLQTLFSRMTRVTKEGYLTDEGGETTNINDVEAALKTAGITLRESKSTFRSTFEVLREIASVWEGLNDIQKGNITYAMAGSRQANMFNTLMAGMGEDGGKLLDEYLGIAEGSEGTVKSKYEVAIESIQAAIDNLKSTFDGFVETLGSNNIITGFMDLVSNIVQGFTDANNAGKGWITVLGLIGTAVAALTAKILVMSLAKNTALGDVAGLISTIAAIVGGGFILGATGAFGNLAYNDKVDQNKQMAKAAKENTANLQTKYDTRNKLIDDAIGTIDSITDKYKDTFDSMPEEATNNLTNAVKLLADAFPQLDAAISGVNGSLQEYVQIAEQARKLSEQDRRQQALNLLAAANNGIQADIAGYEEENSKFASTHTGYDFGGEGLLTLQNMVNPRGKLNLAMGMRNRLGSFEDVQKKLTNTNSQWYTLGQDVPENVWTQAAALEAQKAGSGKEYILDYLTGIYSNSTTATGVADILLYAAGKRGGATLVDKNGETVERPDDLINAFNAYVGLNGALLKSSDNQADREIKSFDDLSDFANQNSTFFESYYDGFVDIVEQFMQSLQSGPSEMLNAMLSNMDTLEGNKEKQLQTIFKDNLRPVFTWLGITTDSVIEGFVTKYIEENGYKLDSGAISDFMKEFIDGKRNIYDIFESGNKAAFTYSASSNGGANFGFNSLDRESVSKALISKMSYDLATPEDKVLDLIKKVKSGVIPSSYNRRLSWFLPFFNDDATIDEQTLMDYVYNNGVNNVTGLRAYSSVSEIAKAVGVTSKSKGYIDEYRELFTMLSNFTDESGNVDFKAFDEATRKARGSIQQALEADPELQKMIKELSSGDATSYTFEYLSSYLLKKALGGSAFGEYMSGVLSTVADLADQQRIVNAGAGNLTPEMKQTIADTYKTSYANVEANVQQYYQWYVQRYTDGLSALTIQAQEDIGSLIEEYYRESGSTEQLSLDELVAKSPNLNQIIQNYSNAGINFGLSYDKDGNPIVTSSVGNLTRVNNNPFISNKTAYSAQSKANIASSLIRHTNNWQELSNRYHANVPELLQETYKQYPELAQYLALTDAGLGDTIEAQSLLRTIQVKIEVDRSGYQDLANLGEISQTIADNFTKLSQMADVNSGEAMSLASQTFGSIFTSGKAVNALQRVLDGTANQTDRKLVSDTYGINAYNMTAEDVDRAKNIVTAESTLINNELSQVPTAYRPLLTSMAGRETGFTVGKDGSVTFAANTSRLQPFNNAMLNYESPFQTNQAALDAYYSLRRARERDGEEFGLKGFAASIANSALGEELAADENYINAVQQGWGYSAENILLSKGLGYQASNQLLRAYNNPDMLKYYNAMVNGDAATLQELPTKDPLITQALQSWFSNWNELVDKTLSGTITTEELNQLQATFAQNQLNDMYESNKDTYDKEAMLGASALYGSPQERVAYLNQLFDRASQFRIDKSILEAMKGAEAYNDPALMKEIAGRVGWSNERISAMTYSDADVESLFADVETQSANFSQSLEAITNACTAHAAEIQGITNRLSEGDTWGWENIAAWSGGTNSLSSQSQRRQRILDLYNIASESTDAADFFSSLSASEIPWIQSASSMEKIVTDPTLAPIFYDMFKRKPGGALDYGETGESLQMAEGVDWQVILQRLFNASAYAGLGYDETYSARMGQLDAFAGGGAGSFIGQLVDGTVDREAFTGLLAGENGLKEWIESVPGAKEALQQFLTAEKDVGNYSARLGNILNNAGADFRKYGDNAEKIQKTLKGLSGTQQDYNATVVQMNKDLTKANNNQWMRNQWRKGDRSSKVVESIMEQTGMSKKDVTNKANKSIVDNLLADAEDVDLSSLESYAQTLTEKIGTELSSINLGEIPVDSPLKVVLNGGSIQDVGIGQLASTLQGVVSDDVIQLMQQLSAYIEAAWDITQSSDGKIKATLKPNSVNFKGGGGGMRPDSKGGGGGGNKKSATDKLLQNIKNRITVSDHRIKMTQLQEEKYNQLGMLSNENNMIEYENTLQQDKAKRLSDGLVKLRAHLKTVERGSDDWQKLYEQILKYEEELDQTNNTITANTLKIQQNNSAIRKARTDLEDLVVQEIEARIQKQRDMLAASVEMQDTILEAIKQRYEEEWEIQKKDLEKKREALEEEKSLIDKRLQMRKDAEDEAKKYEELAEYRRQLALISMDSTRTKDAAELRKKIADTEDELAWKTAEQEANAQKESIDDQIKGVEKYEQYGDEDLELLLEDANNFSTDVAKVMQMNQEDMFKWLKNNVKEYSHSLEDAQTQMVQSWEDTYKQMLGITDTYWDQVNQILSRKDIFKAFMMESDQYKNASETEKEELLYQWLDAVNSGSYLYYLRSREDWAKYSHNDEEFADYVGGESGGGGGGSGGGGGGGGPSKPTNNNTNNDSDYYWGVYNDKGKLVKRFDTKERANSWLNMIAYNDGYYVAKAGAKPKATTTAQNTPAKTNNHPSLMTATPFSEGGEVKYTGLAMVHGTPAKPEAFLDSDDRKTMRGILDSGFMQDMRSMVASFKQINTSSFVRHIYDDSSLASGARVTVGDINISTNQINNEADFEELAVRIGREFVKDLSMQGLSTSKFSF